MKFVGTVLAAAIAASLLSACSSAGPICRHDEGCKEVWVPAHSETKVEYCVVPAKTHSRLLPVMGLCQKTTMKCVESVRTAPVAVPDLCERRVPTYEPDCLPVTGYRRVEDCRDALVPVCEPRCIDVVETVEVPDYRSFTDRCGVEQQVQIGSHSETRVCGSKCVCKKVGERVMSVKAGSHLEQCPCGQRVACVPVGERTATFQTGTHIEQRPVGRDCQCVETGREIRAVRTGTRCDTYETMPWRYRAEERAVEVPGFCATICSNPKHHHRGIVLSEAVYQEYLLAAKR